MTSRRRQARARRERILRLIVRALAAGALVAVAAVRAATAQTAGTANLLSSPGAWPTTGAISGSTALGLDPSALYLNPAGLATQDERMLLVHHGLLQFDTAWDLAAVSYPIPGLGAVGLGVTRIGTSGIDAYSAGNQALGSIDYSETSLAAGVARRVIGTVTAGATFKVLSQSLGDVSAAAPAVDLGVVYRPAQLRGGQVGLSIQNVVAGSLDLGGTTPPIDRAFRLGLASPEWRFQSLTAARAVVDLGKQGSEGVTSRIGVEVSRAGIGSARAGLQGGNATLGVGLSWRRYGVDLAVAQGEVEMTHQLAVRVGFGERLSEYEARRRAEYTKAAEDSLLARRASRMAQDRARAVEAEARGEWESAVVLWEVIAREIPRQGYEERAERARKEIALRAERGLEAESARRLASAMTAMVREAIARGDLEEAEGLRRGLSRPEMGGVPATPESVATLEREIAAVRTGVADRAASRADSLLRAGRLLQAAEEAALALRLEPEHPKARVVWTDLESRVAKNATQAETLSRKLEALTSVQDASRAFNEGRYNEAQAAVRKALARDPKSPEAKAWRERIQRRMSTPKPELDARIKQLYVRGMEAFASGNYAEALKQWEQILAIDPLNESARRHVLETRERLKAEARR
jgi:tetratricopeptide (TPR) repeat protein